MKIIKSKEISDIFSFGKTKKKIFKKRKIYVDYRERNSLVPSSLLELGENIEFKELKIGDYIIKNVVIERKTVYDFISSMKNKRLIKQLNELQQYEKKLLLIEGIDEQELYTDSEDWMGMNPNSIRGFLLSIMLNYKIPIIFSKNYEDTAKFMHVLSKKSGRNDISLNAKKKSLNKKEQIQFILEGFPGIGPKTSEKILKEFKSLKEFVNSSEEKLKNLIGKKGENIYSLLNSEYSKKKLS